MSSAVWGLLTGREWGVARLLNSEINGGSKFNPSTWTRVVRGLFVRCDVRVGYLTALNITFCLKLLLICNATFGNYHSVHPSVCLSCLLWQNNWSEDMPSLSLTIAHAFKVCTGSLSTKFEGDYLKREVHSRTSGQKPQFSISRRIISRKRWEIKLNYDSHVSFRIMKSRHDDLEWPWTLGGANDQLM